MITRRDFLAQTTALAIGGLSAGRLLAQLPAGPGTPITVYKSASCGCCAKWVDHLRENGFVPTVHDEEEMDAIKDEMGVPKAVRSCHTALVDRYLVEGHVPAADLRRVLAERPAIAGLAVPGMPRSTPGMAAPGDAHEPYEVVSFTTNGKTARFAQH
ncbi:MAG TPA: DUF411 domain-containing protein [Gemmatimonadales bacterium]|nr:DUF411 domain-containing protein [Gemmatimonadales bacterium]